MYQNILRSLKFDDYIPKPGETKSGRNKYSKNNLNDHVNTILNIYVESEADSDDNDSEGQGFEKQLSYHQS